MVKTRPRPLWHLVLTAALVLGAIGVLLVRQWQERPVKSHPMVSTPPPEPADSAPALGEILRTRMVPALAEIGIWAELITCQRVSDGPDLATVRVPRDLPLAVVNQELTRLTRECGGHVLRAEETVPRHRVEIRVGFDTVATTIFSLQRAASGVRRRTGRISLIIDDFGYDNGSDRRVRAFCALPPQLSFAVLPNARSIQAFLQDAADSGHPVLLHLPMEPRDPEADPGPGAITVDLDDQAVRTRVLAALARVPTAVGVNNHMGSLATEDSRVMEIVLMTLKQRGLFFVDSRTTPESVGEALAQGMGVPTARRDLFIDSVDDLSSIETRLWELADKAARMGTAIGIGHDRNNTLQALQHVLPRLRTRGFHLVPVSQLVH